MIANRVLRYKDAGGLFMGLEKLTKEGLGPRGVLFLALDSLGEPHLVLADQPSDVRRIRVGDKLSLSVPLPPGGRYFYYDSIHRLPFGVLWNGDRRLALPGSAPAVTVAMAAWLRQIGGFNVFLGCAPHQPGSWWIEGEDSVPAAFHEAGFADVIPTVAGLLARRIGEAGLHLQLYGTMFQQGPFIGWERVYESPLGNILMIERRIIGGKLALTCERGIVEVDISRLPEVRESALAEVPLGFGIVGRIDGGAFAVTMGKVEPWGLVDLRPAWLVGTKGQALKDLAQSLQTEAMR